ncbi:MAG: beta-galactosidase trimerization domain-containing protein [bacterium]|nr:beta-galactosidase trimerization domain-containing protein [bacterium]
MNMDKKWWEKPVRMLRVDYAPDFAAVREEDLDALAGSRREEWQINCEWIVGTPGFAGGGYRTTFKAEGYEICPGFENFDYLRSYTPYAHKHGISVIAYLNMHWYTYEFAEKHPGWEQITGAGQSYGRVNPLYGDGTTFCVNSPWREWAFGLMQEAMKTGIDGIFLDGPVIFPDCCCCPICRQKFQEQYGQDIPGEDWHNPAWKAFLDFREDSLAGFLSDAQKRVQETAPEGVIFLNAGSWGLGGWRVARDIQKTGPFQNFNGAEAFFHFGKHQNIYAALMAGKYLRAGDKPAVVFTHYMNGRWHYLNLPPGEVKLALAQTTAAGANPWWALINSSLTSQPQSNEPVREGCGLLEKHEEYLIDTESLAEVGLLFSSQTNRNYLSRIEALYETTGSGKEENLIVNMEKERRVDWPSRKRQCEELLYSASLGYFHALTRAHIPFDILLDQDLIPEKLSRYKTLILADAACLKESSASAIREFVQQGGNLLASFEAGFYDDQGDPVTTLWEPLGIERVDGLFPVMMGENYLQADSKHLGYGQGSLIERGAYALKVQAAENTEIPARYLEPIDKIYTPLKGLSPYPALIIHRYGQGRTAYFPEAMGHFFRETGMISAEDRISRMVREMNGSPIIEVDAPKTLSLEIYRQEKHNRIIIHLVNNTVDSRPVNQFLPLSGIELTLNLKETPRKVYSLIENSALESFEKDGFFHINVPRLSFYDMIVLDM